MYGEIPHLASFCVVLARIGGIFTFFPIPGLKVPVDASRLLLSLFLTLALFPVWRGLVLDLTPMALVAVLASEMVFGLAGGLVIGFMFETFQFAAQILGQQAGFSYASTIDPSNNTDSGVLLVFCQLLTSWLAIAAGLDHRILFEIARSLQTLPPGAFSASPASLALIAKAGTTAFEVGLGIAVPSIGIFLLLDVLLGVLSRLEQQLQLTTVLFPVKTAGSILVILALIGGFPTIFQKLYGMAMASIHRLAGF